MPVAHPVLLGLPSFIIHFVLGCHLVVPCGAGGAGAGGQRGGAALLRLQEAAEAAFASAAEQPENEFVREPVKVTSCKVPNHDAIVIAPGSRGFCSTGMKSMGAGSGCMTACPKPWQSAYPRELLCECNKNNTACFLRGTDGSGRVTPSGARVSFKMVSALRCETPAFVFYVFVIVFLFLVLYVPALMKIMRRRHKLRKGKGLSKGDLDKSIFKWFNTYEGRFAIIGFLSGVIFGSVLSGQVIGIDGLLWGALVGGFVGAGFLSMLVPSTWRYQPDPRFERAMAKGAGRGAS